MAQANPPIPQIAFGGIVTKGSPLNRPPNSSVRCQNIRIMPSADGSQSGNLRLRGGRTRRVAGSTGGYRQFFEFRKADGAGGIYHLAQHVDGSSVAKWKSLDLATYTLADLITISQSYGFSDPNLSPICTVRTKAFFGNGLGVRGATSQPALSSWDGTTVRYVGIDMLTSGGSPTAAMVLGTGFNHILASITIYAGLFNTTTGHFSNGVSCGRLTTIGAGTISVSNLSRITTASNNGTEAAELKYVFYATVDSGTVPYLILNAGGTDVFTAAIGSGTASLSLTASGTDTMGFLLDLTQEMPTENFPPRPLNLMCYANGRIYGSLLANSGSGAAATYRGFSYAVTAKDLSAVVWCAAADDYVETAFVGVPEEAWPLLNKKYTPNGEQPILITPSPLQNQVIVITKTATFSLQETADGLHTWATISEVDGILNAKTYVKTAYGPMWVSQKKQIVRYVPNQVEPVSESFSELLSWPGYAAIGSCADYLRDPANHIDRYQVWRIDGSSVCLDFAMGWIAYETTGPVFYTAKSLLDGFGQTHHIVANAAMYTQEADPYTGLIPTRDQNSDATYSEISGDYIGQWIAFGMPDVRKEFGSMFVTGDAAFSAILAKSPVTLSWYLDTDSAQQGVDLIKTPQSLTDMRFEGRMSKGNAHRFKYRIQIAGHTADAATYYYNNSIANGDLTMYPYGTVYELDLQMSAQGNNRG